MTKISVERTNIAGIDKTPDHVLLFKYMSDNHAYYIFMNTLGQEEIPNPTGVTKIIR